MCMYCFSTLFTVSLTVSFLLPNCHQINTTAAMPFSARRSWVSTLVMKHLRISCELEMLQPMKDLIQYYHSDAKDPECHHWSGIAQLTFEAIETISLRSTQSEKPESKLATSCGSRRYSLWAWDFPWVHHLQSPYSRQSLLPTNAQIFIRDLHTRVRSRTAITVVASDLVDFYFPLSKYPLSSVSGPIPNLIKPF